jgi:hypothetical protein
MKHILIGLAALFGLVATAAGQVVPFPQSLPPSTVIGRMPPVSGPAQAIPFSVLTTQLTGSGSGIFGLTLSGNTDYAMVGTDRTVLINAALTAPRTVTLFAAATLATGQQICIADAFGGVTSTNTLTIARSSTDTINGATSYVITSAFGGDCLISDGVSKWTISRVQNAGLANMPANTFKGNNTAAVASPTDLTIAQVKASLGISVMVTDPAFGAVCDGTTNDATAIQAAINSLPANGGTVLFPLTPCKINSTLTIGNGNSTPTSSTVQGITLAGVSDSQFTTTTGFNIPTGPKLVWGGGAGAMIQVNGPLQGWGVKNLALDCQSVASSIGIRIFAAIYGDNDNVTIINCQNAIMTSSYPNRNTMHNMWSNIFIQVPAIVFATGISLDGDGVGATSNTAFEHYHNLSIFLPATLQTFGINLRATDSDEFFDLHIAGGSATATGVQFDYSAAGITGQWPASVMFFGTELNGSPMTPWGLSGTPGAGAKPNYIFGHGETNGAAVPILNNLAVYSSNAIVVNPGGNNASTNILGAWAAFTPTLVCGTATFTVNSARALVVGKTTHLKIDFTISALGTCTTPVTFTIPNTAQATGVLPGLDVSTSTAAAGCKLAAASATATCLANTGANFAAQNYMFSGIYENQ